MDPNLPKDWEGTRTFSMKVPKVKREDRNSAMLEAICRIGKNDYGIHCGSFVGLQRVGVEALKSIGYVTLVNNDQPLMIYDTSRNTDRLRFLDHYVLTDEGRDIYDALTNVFDNFRAHDRD